MVVAENDDLVITDPAEHADRVPARVMVVMVMEQLDQVKQDQHDR